MSYNKSGKWTSLVAHVDGGLTAAAGTNIASVVVPFDGYIERVTMSVQEGGASSGNNEVMLVEDSSDLFAADTLQTAYSANGTSESIVRSDLNAKGAGLFDEGDVIYVQLDEGAGGSPANLTVTIHMVGN